MKELSEFAEVLDNVPPGSDELVALATVVKLVKEGSPSGRWVGVGADDEDSCTVPVCEADMTVNRAVQTHDTARA